MCGIGAIFAYGSDAPAIDRDALLAAVQDPAIKQRLKDETGLAIEAGVFGSPFFIIDGEPFWGADRLWMIRRWLKTGGW